MKTYKIYRWAYEDSIDTVTVPDNAVFYEIMSFDNPKNTEYGIVKQNRYIAVFPYDEKEWKSLQKAEGQSYTMAAYNISDKHVVIYLKDAYPISKDFPLTDNLTFPVCYLKVRGIKQIKDVEKSFDEVVAMAKAEQKNYLRPVISYVKINGFSKNFKDRLDVTRVDVGSWLDERKMMRIARGDETIEEALSGNSFMKIDKSYAVQFTRAYNHVASQMKNENL